MDLIAKRSLPYRGKVYKKNQPLSTSTRDGRALVAIGRAIVAPKVIEPEPPKEEPKKAEVSPDKPKRRYRRRDMKAES